MATCKTVTRAMLRQARKDAGMSQNDLGGLIGVTGSAVGQWESGASTPRWSMVAKLSEVLEINLQDDGADVLARVEQLERTVAVMGEQLETLLGDAVEIEADRARRPAR